MQQQGNRLGGQTIARIGHALHRAFVDSAVQESKLSGKCGCVHGAVLSKQRNASDSPKEREIELSGACPPFARRD